jgi:hypothetical protein
MQTQDDDFPYTSDDPSLEPVEDKSLTSQQLNDLRGTLHLVVGSALNGKDALTNRLRQMQVGKERIKIGAITVDENETSQDRLRYLLLGILFEIPDVFERGIKTAGGSTSKVYDFLSKKITPITNSWMFSPVRNQYDYAAARGEKVFERLIMKGRIEEQNSRLMLQQEAIDDLINEFAEYLVLKIKVQEIIQQEGAAMAGDVVDEFQQQSSGVDSILEDKLKSIFKKRVSPEPTAPPSNPAEEG